MKFIVFIFTLLLSLNLFSQEITASEEEFIPIIIEDKEAFISTKTGEFVYKEHANTDPTALKTTSEGVTYAHINTHKVMEGETLSMIAKKYGLSVSALKLQNKLSKTDLHIGQKLKIIKKTSVKSSSPIKGTKGEETIIAKLSPGQTPASLNAPSVNVTKDKETLNSINKTYKVTSETITKSKETLNEKEISKNEKESIINIDKTEQRNFYKVKSGDTLYNIAKRFAISVQNLKKINKLTSNNLAIGQELKINEK